VLRSIVWKFSGDFHHSTRVAAGAGQIAAYGFMLYGVYSGMAAKNLVGGLWLVFIGWFLLRAAKGSVAQLSIRQAMSGVRAGDILDTSTPYVSPAISLQDLVREYIMRYGQSRFLVYDGDTLRGLITTPDINGVPQEDWASTSVQAAMVPCRELPTVGLNEPVEHVMEILDENQINQIPVVEKGVFHGLATRETIVRMLQTRMQYGQ
jgi:predicted transcriptional regulator